MTEFDQHIKDVCDYIEERMRVVARYDSTYDELRISFNNSDDFYMCINYIRDRFYNHWRNYAVGVIAQELMRDIKDEWVSLLMRKDGV